MWGKGRCDEEEGGRGGGTLPGRKQMLPKSSPAAPLPSSWQRVWQQVGPAGGRRTIMRADAKLPARRFGLEPKLTACSHGF